LAFHSGREADHSSPSGAEVKEWVEVYLHSPNTPSWRGAQGEHRDNFTFYFIKIYSLKTGYLINNPLIYVYEPGWLNKYSD
jgi:hypothetical protein